MTAVDPAKKLTSLLKSLVAAHGDLAAEPWFAAAPPCGAEAEQSGPDPLVNQFLFSFMLWRWRATPAAEALGRLLANVVDVNELRVCLPEEIAAAAGDTSDVAMERATRLRAALHELYRREHVVTLSPLSTLGKREARLYLESLDGVPPFVAARVSLLSLGGHAFPLDERLHAALEREQAVPTGLTLGDAGNWLERHFRAGEAASAYILLEAWVDAAPATSAEPASEASAGDREPKAKPKRRAPKAAGAEASTPKKPRTSSGGKRAEP